MRENEGEAVLDVIGDGRARQVLFATRQESCSAKEISDRTGISLPTVYRRLEELREYDLVRSEMRAAADGNHYEVFTCNFDETRVSLEDEGYDVVVERREDITERFVELWDDLAGEP